ncbi:MAG: hypothetical protein Q8Q62_12470, partial [Mesorhizobium sp.]|nr:hypothetical protein [Mesorhizobium sp.]
WDEMCGRADWCMAHLPYTGNLMLDEEDSMLLRECLSAYVYGMYAVAIISADAFLERVVTDCVETAGRDTAKLGFGQTLKSFRELKLVDQIVLDRVDRLHKIRNNLAHERGPDDQMRLFRRALERRTLTQEIAKDDAKEAVCIAYGLAGRLKGNFPRLNLPGLANPVIERSVFKE